MDWKNWKLWVVVAIIAAVIFAAVVCHLVQPKVTYAWLEIVAGCTLALGVVLGVVIDRYLLKKKYENFNKTFLY